MRWVAEHRYVFPLHVSMMVCKHKLVSGLFATGCMKEKVVLGSNGGAITAGSQLCRVESTTSK